MSLTTSVPHARRMAAVSGPQPCAPPCAWPSRELENDSAPDFARAPPRLDPEYRPRVGSPKKLFGERIFTELDLRRRPRGRVYSAMRCLGYALRRLPVVSSCSTPRAFQKKRVPPPPMACQPLTGNCISASSLATKPHVVKQGPSSASYGSIISHRAATPRSRPS